MDSASFALTKYAAIYDLASGALLVKTTTLAEAPPLDPQAREVARRGEELLVHITLPDEGRTARRLRGVWVPAPEPVAPRAVLLLAVPDEMISEVRFKLRSAAAATAAGGLLLASLVARLLSLRLTRGTEAIARTMRAIAAGDLSRRVDVKSHDDEIAGLSADLNDMIDRLGRLLQAQRRFTSDAAHELRSPLTALRGQLEVALRRERDAAAYRECLESCLDDVERLTRMAEDLLALSRLEGRPTRGDDEVALRNVAEETLLSLSEQASSLGVSLRLAPGAEVRIRGDALQLSRLLRNLLENALRASPPGETVEVAVEQQGGLAMLSVLDRGPGVPVEMRAHLFEPFMRSDEGRARAHGGTGLGLAIAREIARVHGGDLSYGDRPGGGARFTATMTC